MIHFSVIIFEEDSSLIWDFWWSIIYCHEINGLVFDENRVYQ